MQTLLKAAEILTGLSAALVFFALFVASCAGVLFLFVFAIRFAWVVGGGA